MGKHHGLRYTPEYDIWIQMKQRCENPNNKNYEDYGGRGISVCGRWSGKTGVVNFYKDKGPRPSSRHQIERIDNNGDYTPKNTRWATRKRQANNRRNNVFVEYKGKRMTLAQAVRRSGLKYITVYSRIIRYGWSAERALRGKK